MRQKPAMLSESRSVLIPSNRVMSSDIESRGVERYSVLCLNPLKSGHVFGLWFSIDLCKTLFSLNPLKSGHVFGLGMQKLQQTSYACLNPLKSGHVFGCKYLVFILKASKES